MQELGGGGERHDQFLECVQARVRKLAVLVPIRRARRHRREFRKSCRGSVRGATWMTPRRRPLRDAAKRDRTKRGRHDPGQGKRRLSA